MSHITRARGTLAVCVLLCACSFAADGGSGVGATGAVSSWQILKPSTSWSATRPAGFSPYPTFIQGQSPCRAAETKVIPECTESATSSSTAAQTGTQTEQLLTDTTGHTVDASMSAQPAPVQQLQEQPSQPQPQQQPNSQSEFQEPKQEDIQRSEQHREQPVQNKLQQTASPDVVEPAAELQQPATAELEQPKPAVTPPPEAVVVAPAQPGPAPARRLLNLAELSDGASVLAANPEAKKPERAIDKDIDSFMKNDCNANKWMIIELSQLGTVETVKLTMKELYSSRVHTFRVFGRSSHPRKDGPDFTASLSSTAWQLLGNFTAENKRGTQSFSLPQRSRVRYLLLMFDTHYGNEAMCAMNWIEVLGVSAAQELEEALALQELESDADEHHQVFQQPQQEAARLPEPGSSGDATAIADHMAAAAAAVAAGIAAASASGPQQPVLGGHPSSQEQKQPAPATTSRELDIQGIAATSQHGGSTDAADADAKQQLQQQPGELVDRGTAGTQQLQHEPSGGSVQGTVSMQQPAAASDLLSHSVTGDSSAPADLNAPAIGGVGTQPYGDAVPPGTSAAGQPGSSVASPNTAAISNGVLPMPAAPSIATGVHLPSEPGPPATGSQQASPTAAATISGTAAAAGVPASPATDVSNAGADTGGPTVAGPAAGTESGAGSPASTAIPVPNGHTPAAPPAAATPLQPASATAASQQQQQPAQHNVHQQRDREPSSGLDSWTHSTATKPKQAGNLFDVIKSEMMQMKLDQGKVFKKLDSLAKRSTDVEALAATLQKQQAQLLEQLENLTTRLEQMVQQQKRLEVLQEKHFSQLQQMQQEPGPPVTDGPALRTHVQHQHVQTGASDQCHSTTSGSMPVCHSFLGHSQILLQPEYQWVVITALALASVVGFCVLLFPGCAPRLPVSIRVIVCVLAVLNGLLAVFLGSWQLVLQSVLLGPDVVQMRFTSRWFAFPPHRMLGSGSAWLQ